MAEDHSRWCPRCSSWATESELRVPADGKPRHKACGSVTLSSREVDAAGNILRPQTHAERLFDGPRPGGMVLLEGDAEAMWNRTDLPRGVVGGPPLDCGPWPDAEARELAGRMALDEAAEGNHGAAAELQAFAELKPGQLQVGVALEPIATGAEGMVLLGGVSKTLTAMASWQQALEQDLCKVDLRSDDIELIAKQLLELGWVPGARRRAVELPKATATLAEDDRYEDQPVTDTDGTVIGHIWEVLPHHRAFRAREWRAAVDENEKNRPVFDSREGAEAWVRANAPRDGRPLTVPYDAEKVLGLKSAVIGWVWLDPEHAGDDGRWLAIHGAHPEHQHPLFGSKSPGLDARNQAIGWVLEQDKAARS